MSPGYKTWHIQLSGLVQGVGFRPCVYNLAVNYELKGWVNNDVDGLHIIFNATKSIAEKFHSAINLNSPAMAKIISSTIIEIEHEEFEDFRIIHQADKEKTRSFPTPDFATCNNCNSEVKSAENRRFSYPFITCSECGPRYSIIQSLPFDRHNTKMHSFSMCDRCTYEYNNPNDRRYYAQTNSCIDCGISLKLFKSKTESISLDNRGIIEQILKCWSDGKIIAIKGIGGYLITCDASNLEAIARLRRLKIRPDKPFALMYPDLNHMEEFQLSKEEKRQLQGPVSPIVLVKKQSHRNILSGICDHLSRVGIMIPYAPIFQLLLLSYEKAIVATSGNISNSPIIHSDIKALEDLFEIADYVLINNREIVTPQDDSVVGFSAYFNQEVIFRRSRGIAPNYYNPCLNLSKRSIIAMGAQLKSTFALLHHENIYVSQYLGDLENYDSEVNYKNTLEHLTDLLGIKPELVIVDSHPNYLSSQIGKGKATHYNIPILEVQHHIAHFSALLGENAIYSKNKRILGVIWDGTGLGTDHNIWGGEFFIYENFRFERVDHVEYFDHLVGDKMSKEPRLSALSMCSELPFAQPILKEKFTHQEWVVYSQILSNSRSLKTSSIGRLFDGIASLLNILDIQTYEGQAASMLQVKAEEYFEKVGLEFNESYFNSANSDGISVLNIVEGVLKDLMQKKVIEMIAAKFHISLVHWIRYIAQKQKVKYVGFSGGVFQNTLLVDLIIYHLSPEYELLFHKQLSPNDENISFGQIIYAEILSKRGE